MKPDYAKDIESILAGETIGSAAKRLGVNMNTLRRLLIVHPDYAKAKADGKLHAKGIPPKLRAGAADSVAVAEVVAGSGLQATADKHGIPVSSLAKMVHSANPGLNLHMRNATREQLAEAALRKANRALKKARELAIK